ncbi:AfsR/SARP family transcriptional regulator [Saccharothrix xinjiangensis]|uniref:AfsR/SARP family transcriptional regulator n=1 Tax=Saccharothrix xinjiangensis TaxID=204798 RepID=A0ABV9Y311_9PSEU
MHSSIRTRLLVALVVNLGSVVSKDRLAQELWPRERPDNTVGALQAHVSRLRRDLRRWCGSRLRVEPLHLGYRVVADGGAEVDIGEFEDLAVRAGRAVAADPARALGLAHRALALWRDEPFTGLDVGLEGQAARIGLQETRWELWETAFDAALATGAADGVVADIRRLLLASPFRERFHAQLMVALYRAGRLAEALEAHRLARALVIGELGVEPSRVLDDCVAAILRHDPRLWQDRPLNRLVARRDPA